MKTKAAILVDTTKPLIIDELEIPKLKPGQVLVEIKYSGVCHTQILEARGQRGKDAFLPHCLGHEASGIVLEISPGINKVKKDDHVILSWMKGKGANIPSTAYTWKGNQVNAGAITTFSKYSIISENRLTVIPKKFPLKVASLMGCVIPTGLGAVFNTAKVKPGQSIAIFGCGGIGFSAIQAAKIAGCAPIFAIDINESKLKLAKQFGATYCINAKQINPVEFIQNHTNLDFAIEASGNPLVMIQALESVKSQGGRAVIIGNADHNEQLIINPKLLNMGKNLLGTWGGDNQPDIHFPRYCKLVDHEHLCVHPFTEHSYSLEQVNQALDDLERGTVLRPLIDMALT